MKIIPTIFAHNKKEFNKRFKKILPISKNIQIDFMDGKFVPEKSIQLKGIPKLPKNKNFEVHLMCFSPEKYFLKLKKRSFKKIIFHIESTNNPKKVIEQAKKLNLKILIAINPSTQIQNALPYLKNVEGILFMGVHPGKEHQKFITRVYKKIARLKRIYPNAKIQVDGGVNLEVAKKLAKLKVNTVNSGSYIANADNPRETLKKLESIV